MFPAPALPGIAAKQPVRADARQGAVADWLDCVVTVFVVETVWVTVTVFVPPQAASASTNVTARAARIMSSETSIRAGAHRRAKRRRRRSAAAPGRGSRG